MAPDSFLPAGRPVTRRVRFKRVLILDPDELWCGAVRAALAARGYRSCAASSADAGLERLHDRPFDLALISYRMGDWVLETLSRNLGGLRAPPSLVVIETADDAARSEAWRFLKPAATLRRPCASREVVAAVARLLGPPWIELAEGA